MFNGNITDKKKIQFYYKRDGVLQKVIRFKRGTLGHLALLMVKKS